MGRIKQALILVGCVVLDHYLSRICAMPGTQLALAPVIIGGAIAAAGALGGAALSGSKTTSQVPLEDENQRQARLDLLNFATSGRLGGYTAGQNLNLGYGDYNMTAPEAQGQSALQRLLAAGPSPMFATGDAALQDFLATSPNAIDKQFQPFKALTDRSIGESDAAYKRGAGFAGNLYSTSTMKGLGDIEARGNEQKVAKLADLQNSALDRRLQAIPLAYQSAEAQQAAQLQSIAASQQYGDLSRTLNDASIKARDAELIRRQQESGQQVQALESAAGSSAPFGVPSVTTSPYQQLLGLIGSVGGSYLGNYAGAAGAAAGKPDTSNNYNAYTGSYRVA